MRTTAWLIAFVLIGCGGNAPAFPSDLAVPPERDLPVPAPDVGELIPDDMTLCRGFCETCYGACDTTDMSACTPHPCEPWTYCYVWPPFNHTDMTIQNLCCASAVYPCI